MFHYTVGIDEAGRGPFAGPVTASAVLFLTNTTINGLNDSKKLTEEQRETLAPLIKENSLFGIGWATVEEIEELNILNATFLAMERAVTQLSEKINLTKDTLFLIDGNTIPPFLKQIENSLINKTGIEAKAIIKGDAKVKEIMAASILAKTERDAYMREMDAKYPQYGFKKHKGYGTEAHIKAIQKFGLSPIHRPSFCKKYVSSTIV